MQHPVNLCRQTITIKNIHLNVVTNTIYIFIATTVLVTIYIPDKINGINLLIIVSSSEAEEDQVNSHCFSNVNVS